MKEKNIDLTQGVIWKKLLKFFFPVFIGCVFQQIYTSVDAIIVGQFVGKDGLGAIDAVSSMLRLPVIFFCGLSTGATIMISQFFGGGKTKELSQAVHTAVAFAIIAGFFLSVLGLLIAPLSLELLEVPDTIYESTLAYVRIYFAGLLVILLYNIGAGILRANGDSKSPSTALVIAGIVNIVLDLMFVAVFRWGIAGAALGTVIAELVSAIIVINALLKAKGSWKLRISSIRFHKKMLSSILRFGLPLALQGSMYPVANMIVQASINKTGTTSLAAWALCSKLDFPIWITMDALAATISVFVAQNVGAKQEARALRGVRMGMLFSLGIVLAFSAVLFFFSGPLGTIFINKKDYDIIPITTDYMRFLAPFYFTYVFGEIFASAMRGAGEMIKPMLAILFGTCAMRVAWMLAVVPRFFHMKVIMSCFPISWVITSIVISIMYIRFRCKLIQYPIEL